MYTISEGNISHVQMLNADPDNYEFMYAWDVEVRDDLAYAAEKDWCMVWQRNTEGKWKWINGFRDGNDLNGTRLTCCRISIYSGEEKRGTG